MYRDYLVANDISDYPQFDPLIQPPPRFCRGVLLQEGFFVRIQHVGFRGKEIDPEPLSPNRPNPC